MTEPPITGDPIIPALQLRMEEEKPLTATMPSARLVAERQRALDTIEADP